MRFDEVELETVAVDPGPLGGTNPPAGEISEAPRLRRLFALLTDLSLFAALILGLGGTGSGLAEKLAFVVGAITASLSWQTLIAAAGAALHRRLAPRLRLVVGIVGNVIVLAFAAVIAVGLAR